ncbi:MAG TPA: mucin-associated surface protein [Arthrobacter sp.]
MSLINRQSRSAGRNNPRLRLAGAVLGMALVTASLASCSAAPDLDRNAARQLQSKVLAVTGAAAANDPAASLKLLDAFVLELDEAAARGEVSFRRHQSISKSVDAVRADLKARQAEAARVAAEQKAKAAADNAAADKAAAEAAAAQAAAAAAAPPPAVAPAPADRGKSKGKGKD